LVGRNSHKGCVWEGLDNFGAFCGADYELKNIFVHGMQEYLEERNSKRLYYCRGLI
jgi:hypothetical protein